MLYTGNVCWRGTNATQLYIDSLNILDPVEKQNTLIIKTLYSITNLRAFLTRPSSVKDTDNQCSSVWRLQHILAVVGWERTIHAIILIVNPLMKVHPIPIPILFYEYEFWAPIICNGVYYIWQFKVLRLGFSGILWTSSWGWNLLNTQPPTPHSL